MGRSIPPGDDVLQVNRRHGNDGLERPYRVREHFGVPAGALNRPELLTKRLSRVVYTKARASTRPHGRLIRTLDVIGWNGDYTLRWITVDPT